jgi:hypothetical protein
MAEQKRFSQGWLNATQRPQCGNCQHSEQKINNPDSLSESITFRCAYGDFATSKTAICNQYEVKARG